MKLDAQNRIPDKFKAVRAAFSKAASFIHNNKGFTSNDINKKPIKSLTKATFNVLKDAMNDGIEHEMPETMRKKLEQDVFVFSGMKTYTQLKEVSGKLLTEDGQRKPLEQFKNDVSKIDAQYNQNYLEAEYQFATQSAQMADNWQELTKDGDKYNLQYRTAGDSHVRAEHEALQNITLPVSDAFWDSYYPPNGWRCRCTAAQVSKSKYEITDSDQAEKLGKAATTSINKDGKNTAEIFRFNPGKQNVIFPPDHPYSKVAKSVKGKLAA